MDNFNKADKNTSDLSGGLHQMSFARTLLFECSPLPPNNTFELSVGQIRNRFLSTISKQKKYLHIYFSFIHSSVAKSVTIRTANTAWSFARREGDFVKYKTFFRLSTGIVNIIFGMSLFLATLNVVYLILCIWNDSWGITLSFRHFSLILNRLSFHWSIIPHVQLNYGTGFFVYALDLLKVPDYISNSVRISWMVNLLVALLLLPVNTLLASSNFCSWMPWICFSIVLSHINL